MALDESVLDQNGPPALRFFHWAVPSLTFGYFQTWAEAEAAAARAGVSGPIRRPTAGGVVVHRGDVTFSFIFPWTSSLTPQAIYKNIHRGVHLSLKARGPRTRLLTPAAAFQGTPQDCFAQPSACDLVLDVPFPGPPGAKVLGGALRKRRGRGLYQGTFLPPPDWDKDLVREAITEGLAQEWELKWTEREVSGELLARADSLAADRYRTKEWNHKR